MLNIMIARFNKYLPIAIFLCVFGRSALGSQALATDLPARGKIGYTDSSQGGAPKIPNRPPDETNHLGETVWFGTTANPPSGLDPTIKICNQLCQLYGVPLPKYQYHHQIVGRRSNGTPLNGYGWYAGRGACHISLQSPNIARTHFHETTHYIQACNGGPGSMREGPPDTIANKLLPLLSKANSITPGDIRQALVGCNPF